MFSFVKTDSKVKEEEQIDFRKEKQKRERFFTIVYSAIGFILLNVILYLLTKS